MFIYSRTFSTSCRTFINECMFYDSYTDANVKPILATTKRDALLAKPVLPLAPIHSSSKNASEHLQWIPLPPKQRYNIAPFHTKFKQVENTSGLSDQPTRGYTAVIAPKIRHRKLDTGKLRGIDLPWLPGYRRLVSLSLRLEGQLQGSGID